MALIVPTPLDASLPNGARAAESATLATDKTTTGETDHFDTIGRVGRIYIVVVNGITNGVTVQAEGSVDGTNWATVAHRVDAATAFTATANAVAAAATEIMFLDPTACPRYVRANITVANTVGTTISVYAERT